MDTHLYLEHSSAHPQSILTKGPYGQYFRIRRICSLDSDFEINAKTLTGYYLKRSYPFPSLKKHYHRARKFSQEELLDTVSKPATEAPVMVTQYNPRNPQTGSVPVLSSTLDIHLQTCESVANCPLPCVLQKF